MSQRKQQREYIIVLNGTGDAGTIYTIYTMMIMKGIVGL